MTPRWDDIAETVRRRVRRLVLVRGLGWICAAVIGLTWVAAVMDWSLHLDAPLVRLLLLAGIVAASLGVLWRTLLRPLLVRLSDVDIARVLEDRLSQPEDRLSSAAQFRSMHEDPSLGSTALQQATIAKADRAIEQLDLERVFSTRSSRRAVTLAAIISVIALATAVAAPDSARTALQRLAMPFAEIPWPRTTRLRLLDSRLAFLADERLRTTAGEPLTIYVENELGTLPGDLTLDLRLADDTRQQQSLRTTLLRDTDGQAHEVGIVTLMAYQGPLQFRVWGGDDPGTDWRTVDVVPAPTLTKLSIRVTPPDYTGREPQTVEGAGLIEGLVGSRVAISGRANGPLDVATLHREDRPAQPMTLSEDGTRFRTDFIINEPGQSWYWFELVDEHGLTEPDPPRYELRGISDRPPVVYIDQPATDLTVTPDAEVPLRAVARDDWGLTAMRLQYTDAQGFETDNLDASDAPDRPKPHSIALPMSAARSLEEISEMSWQLASLALSPGTRLTFWVEALDACDLDENREGAPGQVGASSFRHLDVISESDKKRELAARQSGILDTLEALRERQAQARDMTAQLRIQAELARRLRSTDIDLLKQAELEQRDIRRQVADDASGLAGEIQQIQRELETNRIDDPDAAQRMSMLANDLSELGSEMLPKIEQSLARARKSVGQTRDEAADPQAADSDEDSSLDAAEDATPVDEQTSQRLRDAEEAQATALAVFSEAAKLLGGWRQRFHITSELDDIVADQRRVHEETRAIGRDTVAKATSRLSDQQQADLARLSDRQRRLAARLERLLEPPDHEGSSDEESSDRASSAGTNLDSPELQEARSWLRQQGTAGQMHQAAESLKRNEIPATVRAQENVLAALQNFGARLNQSPLDNPETLLSQLRDEQEQVETLRKEQESLAQSSQQVLSPSADPLREEQLQRLLKRQSELADDAAEMARRLKRQQHDNAARTADRAARRMQDAETALQQQQPQGVATNQQEALDDLDQLANELAALERLAKGKAAEQRMQQLAEELRSLADEQQAVREATVDLDARHQERGSWPRSLRRELHELTDRQRGLRMQLDEHQEAFEDVPVVHAALTGAGEFMEDAAKRLDREQTGSSTIAAQQEAEDRLQVVVEIVSSATKEGHQTIPPDGKPASEGEEPQSSQLDLQIATQIQLLRRMQADVKRRTEELASLDAQEQNAEETHESQQRLSREQGRIADLTRTLLQLVIESQRPTSDEDVEPEESP